MFSAIKTNSVLGNPVQNFSGLAFNDTPQKEHVALYAEKDLMINAENNHVHHVGNNQYAKIGQISLMRVGSLPGVGGGGGGSGGGGNGASGTTIEGDTVQSGLITSIGREEQWKTSPVAMPTYGFGGTTVYGINNQDCCGLMHQITFGQATQIVFDPFNSWGYLTKLWKGTEVKNPDFPWAPLGGNQQLYWGTNYQSVYGPNVSYTYAPQFNMTTKPTLLTKLMATTIPLLCLAYELTYCFMDDSKKTEAGIVALAFSGLLIVCNATLLESQHTDQVKAQALQLTALQTATAVQEAGFLQAASAMTGKASSEAARVLLSSGQVQLAKQEMLSISDPAHSITYVDGDSVVAAQNCHLFAYQAPDSTNTTSSVYINAYGQMGKGGSAIITASDQMSLTSGSAYLGLVNKAPTGGELTLQCGPSGGIILRTMNGEAAQKNRIESNCNHAAGWSSCQYDSGRNERDHVAGWPD